MFRAEICFDMLTWYSKDEQKQKNRLEKKQVEKIVNAEFPLVFLICSFLALKFCIC